MTSSPDAELIARAQQNHANFHALYEKYVDRIFRYVYYRTGQHTETAEDLTAEVFTRALGNLDTYEDRGYAYSAYLFQVARSVCREQYGKPVVANIDDVVIPSNAHHVTELQTDLSLLWKRISEFPDHVQEIFELRYIEDLAYEDIGRIVGKKPGAIRTLVSRTIQQLQHSYETTH